MISIILPIYNVESYLPRCLDAVLSQSFRDFELVLVDDGSSDCCGEICDRYAKQDSRIKVLHKANGGLSDARNAGLRAASGDYIAFVDSDDWVEEDFLQKLYDVMQETGADIVECNVRKVYDETAVHAAEVSETSQVPIHDPAVSCFDTESALKELISDNTFRQHVWNKLYRRTCLQDILFVVGKTNEDEFWTYQVFGRAKKVAKLDCALYNYFQRPGSIMQGGYSLKRLDALEAKAERQKYIESYYPALTPLAKRNLIASCIYAGQMTLKNLDGEEKETAIRRITAYRDAFKLQRSDFTGAGKKETIWLRMSQVSFWGTVRVKNLLGKGF